MPAPRLRIVTVRSVNCAERHAALPERKYVQVQPSSVAQATCDLEIWYCRSVGYRSAGDFTVAGAVFARCSGVTFSLRCALECMDGWIRTDPARDRPVCFRFRSLLPASDSSTCHLHSVNRACRIAGRRATKRGRIAEARTRLPDRDSKGATEDQRGVTSREPGAQASRRGIASGSGG